MFTTGCAAREPVPPTGSVAAAFTVLGALVDLRDRPVRFVIAGPCGRREVDRGAFAEALTAARRLDVSRDADGIDRFTCSV